MLMCVYLTYIIIRPAAREIRGLSRAVTLKEIHKLRRLESILVHYMYTSIISASSSFREATQREMHAITMNSTIKISYKEING